MKLSYRGVSYETEPATLDTREGEILGKYRGQDWCYPYPRHISPLQPKFDLKYRGVAYSPLPKPKGKNPSGVGEEITRNFCPMPAKKPDKISSQLLGSTHLDNVRRNLERRLQVAQANGNEQLIHLLEQEFEQLALEDV